MKLRDYKETDIPIMLSVIKEAFAEYTGRLDPPSSAERKTIGIVKMGENSQLSLLDRFKNLLGAGLYLLMMGLLFKALTLIIRKWVSFPISLTFKIKIASTVLYGLACLLGTAWFNSTLNLVKTHLLNGEHKLITKGPFNYVRHPLYATLLLTLPPLMIIWYADLLFLFPWISIYIIAHYVVRIEEKSLLETFGEAYKIYQKYVPALLPYKGAGGVRYRAVRDNIGIKD
jgi:protein-S-isoprenylcysteine O-methyltransferase Ste14